MIRKLFGERYGQKFALTAVELLPGNLVNREVINFNNSNIIYGTYFCLFKKGFVTKICMQINKI